MPASLPNIEELATALLNQCSIVGPPVSLTKVIEAWEGLRISRDKIEVESYILDLGSLGGQILVKESSPYPRQRYSIAHEIGHWVLKEHGIEIRRSCSNNKNAKIEKWCNDFAASLLMPAQWIIKEFINYSNPLEVISGLPSSYQVSRQSMYIRLSNLSYMTLIKIFRNNDRYKIQEIDKNKKLKHGLQKQIIAYINQFEQFKSETNTVLNVDYFARNKLIFRKGKSYEWLVLLTPRFVTDNQNLFKVESEMDTHIAV